MIVHVFFTILCLMSNYFVSLSTAAENCATPHSGYRIRHCPEGWERYKQEKCFKLYPQPMQQPDAQATCVTERANLASIHSLDELEFLISLTLREMTNNNETKDFLTGGVRRGKNWKWLDLTRFDYTLWIPFWGQPVLTPGINCLALACFAPHLNDYPDDYGKMRTWDCTVARPFICQKFQADTRMVEYVV